jgi:serine/threonine-protein kinase
MLALQMEFVSRDQLVDAMHQWVRNKSQPLEAILTEQCVLDAETRVLLTAMVEKHIQMHDGRPDKSLASLNSTAGLDATQLSFDPELQASVSQLTVDSSAPGLLPTRGVGETTSAGQRFRIVRPHAEGGLGRVFVAVDGEFGREVALKEIHTRLADELNVRARFVLEAEITGALEHPGIVPVYGLGQHDDGRPFYAMRFVRGDSLKEAVDRFYRSAKRPASSEKAFEFRQLLGRFIDVCNAIDYAHNRGVLHRDLKPDNVMLGEFGETLVVDWGLAKFISAEEVGELADEGRLSTRSGSGATPTLAGTAVGTPAFMSPEQAAGRREAMGATSDVYGLGATLYYVLTGKPPIRAKDSGETLRKAQRGDFPPPREVRSDADPALESICLKAMSTDPKDRYQTAGEMALEVERYLADEAVLAHTDTAIARLARWSRHHRTLVATVVVALLAATAGLSAITVQQSIANKALRKSEVAIRLEQEEALAQRDLAKRTLTNAVQAINDSLIAVSEEKLLNAPGLQPLRRQLLDEGLGYFQDLMKDYEQDIELRVDAVDTYLRLGEVVREIGTAEETLDYYTKSLEVITDLLEMQPDNPRVLQKLATNLNGMGLNYAETGRGKEASEAYDRALDVHARLMDLAPSRGNQRNMAQTQGNYGLLLLSQGERDEAVRRLSESQRIRRQLAEEYPDAPAFRSGLARDLASWSVLYANSGAADESRQTLEECLDLYKSLCEDYPRVADYRYRYGRNLTNYASMMLRQGEISMALPAAQQSADILGPLSAANPAVAAYKSSAAAALNMLSDLHRYSDQPSESLEDAAQARDMLLDLTTKYPEVDDYHYHLAKSYSNIGRLLQVRGQPEQALQAYQNAASQLEQIKLTSMSGRYNLACYLALCIPLVDSENSESAEPLRAKLTARALQALESAIDSGFTNVEHMRRDTDLASLRQYDEFEVLMQKALQQQDLRPDDE